MGTGLIFTSTTLNTPPTTIQPKTIPPIIDACLPRLGARHSIAFFVSSSFPSTSTLAPATLLHPRMLPILHKLCHHTKLSWYLTKHRRCTKDHQEFKEYFCCQLETFHQEICNHYITEFGGSHKVYAYSPHSCQFYSTSLQALLSLNYIPEQVKIPCWHLPHVCAYCHSRPLPSNLWVYIFDHISAEPHR